MVVRFFCLLVGLCAVAELSAAIITVQIGGATRLNSLSRQRERYSCYWDCDLVGCQIARDDDECAYDCEKICRLKADYVARSGADALDSALKPKSSGEPATASEAKLEKELAADLITGKLEFSSPPFTPSPISGHQAAVAAVAAAAIVKRSNRTMPQTSSPAKPSITRPHRSAGNSVRLHLPRNVSARNFAIWERCSQDSGTGQLTEKPFNL